MYACLDGCTIGNSLLLQFTHRYVYVYLIAAKPKAKPTSQKGVAGAFGRANKSSNKGGDDDQVAANGKRESKKGSDNTPTDAASNGESKKGTKKGKSTKGADKGSNKGGAAATTTPTGKPKKIVGKRKRSTLDKIKAVTVAV
jgi:hypothetical protein